ncbi:hypothetical protein J6590_089945 [Homalodisca vitripennis]|nr:hypothetical protein J6590_089945 [Homalodisca vitripennis]
MFSFPPTDKREEEDQKEDREEDGRTKCGKTYRRGLQKIQVEEEETWNDTQKWRRLCTTTCDNGNV